MISEALRARREAICVEHMTHENAHRFDRAIAAFAHASYEIVPTGEVYDGADRVHELIRENQTGFPDFGYHPEQMHHAVPFAVPGSTYARARAARDRLLAIIRSTIAARRREPGRDALSTMLTARAADGRTYSDEEALLEIQHILLGGIIVFALMVEVLRRLAEQPRLLERCAAEIDAQTPSGALTVESLASLTVANHLVFEAKRSVPLVPLAFGRALRSFTFGSFRVPEGWAIYLALWLNNRDPAIFADPERFDPDRFARPRAENEKHPLAFIPQGAPPRTGHQCLGLDYSTSVVLALVVMLVRGYRWQLPPQRLQTDWSKLSPEPLDGLRVRLTPRSQAGRGQPSGKGG